MATKLKLFAASVLFSLIVFSSVPAEAKTKSLLEVEGDRVVTLSIDKKVRLPRKFLRGAQAKQYLGSMDALKEKVTTNPYTGENVIRHASSSRYLNISDGVIFNTGGGKIGYAVRRDGAFTVIIDYPRGRKLKEVDEALFDVYANVINDDCREPHVFFNKEGEEAAILFLPRSMRVFQETTKDGLVAIEVFEQI